MSNKAKYFSKHCFTIVLLSVSLVLGTNYFWCNEDQCFFLVVIGILVFSFTFAGPEA